MSIRVASPVSRLTNLSVDSSGTILKDEDKWEKSRIFYRIEWKEMIDRIRVTYLSTETGALTAKL